MRWPIVWTFLSDFGVLQLAAAFRSTRLDGASSDIQMNDWPHTPSHMFNEKSTYMVTGATFRVLYRVGGSFWLPSSHTTVRTDPYTAVHDHYALACTMFIIGRYPISSMRIFDNALCIPYVLAILHGPLLLYAIRLVAR